MQNEAELPGKYTNGVAKSTEANGSASRKETMVSETVDGPGLMQLLICVLGIYAAL